MEFSITSKKSKVKAVATVTPAEGPEPNNIAMKEIEENCYKELIDMVQTFANSAECSTSAIMNMMSLRVMSQQLPESEEEMLKIPHVTKANFEKYGKDLLDVTRQYAAEKISKIMEYIELPL